MYFSDEWLAGYLAVYFPLWVFSLFFLRAWLVWRRTGIFPVMVDRGATAHGFLARYLFVLSGLTAIAVVAFVLFPGAYSALIPFPFLESSLLRLIGTGIMLPALFIMFVAQAQMGASWRVGIDTQNKTPLVAYGLFRLSRNPIYVGMLMTLIGLFLALPNVLTFFVLSQAWLAAEIEVRLEEEFLLEAHGVAFVDYCAKVRRWI